jgi:phosphate:Na+ symporter
MARCGLVAMCLFPFLAWAASEAPDQLNWLKMMMELFGGLALFLFGMDQMSEGLKAAAGDQMKTLLSKLTKNRFMAAITGAFVTAVIQSSSVTTVLVVGFVSAGLMTLSQSIGVIMGANVGTTITAQIVAFKVEEAALVMIAAGFAMMFLSKKESVQQYGNMLMGLGLIFFGMGIMSDGMSPLRSYEHGAGAIVVGHDGYCHRHGKPGLHQPAGRYRARLRRQHRNLYYRDPFLAR